MGPSVFLVTDLPLPLKYIIQKICFLAAPPLFYIIAAEKDRLKSLSKISPWLQNSESNESVQPKVVFNLKYFLCSYSTDNQPEEMQSADNERGGVGAERGDAEAEGGGAEAEGGGAEAEREGAEAESGGAEAERGDAEAEAGCAVAEAKS